MEDVGSESVSPSVSATETIAFIPARGGSISIPRKNLAPLLGVPLLEYTIRAAVESKAFSQILVSSDDLEIREFAERLGCQIHERPARLATEKSRVIEAVLDAFGHLPIDTESQVCVLQPTSPLRRSEHITEALELFSSVAPPAVVSVVECEHHPQKTLLLKNGRLLALHSHRHLEASRQDLPRAFRPNGAIYLLTVQTARRTQSLIPEDSLPLFMSRDDSADIDSHADLLYAEQSLLARRSTESHTPSRNR